MAQLPNYYDPNQHEPDTGRPDPFPDGRYRFMVLATDVKRTRAGDGSFLVIEHEVQGGPYDRRKFFNQITLENPNVQAVEIGQRQLSALCHAVGFLQALTDSDALHGRSGEVEIGTEEESFDKTTGKRYPAKNVVKRYVLPGEGAGNGRAQPQEQQHQPAAASPPQQRAASGSRPWR